MFWIGFIVGFLVGAPISLFIFALLRASKEEDK